MYAMLMHFYGLKKSEIDAMSLWYIDRFIDNIGNIENWKNGGTLKTISIEEQLIEEQGLNKGVF